MTYLQIARSYRENGKVKQQVLFTLGRLDVLQESGQIDGLLKALGRFAAKQQLIDLSQDVSIEEVYYLGAAHVVRRMLDRTGLWKTLTAVAHQRKRMQIPWLQLMFGMILSRFVEPCSKRRLHREWWRKLYPELMTLPEDKQGLELHWFYRAMDVLYRHRDDIERALFDRRGERDLFNQTIDVVFYDTTTLYFESTNKDCGELRQHGYSKEHRSDCVQVILGLLVDRDGIPVGYELFPGNTYDTKSVPKILDKLRTKYQLGRIIFVGDRGMVSKENIQEIRAAGLEFILGARLWKMAANDVAGFFDLAGYTAVGKDDTDAATAEKSDPKFLIREEQYRGERLIITWSQQRADRDAHKRDELVEKIKTLLEEAPTPKTLVTNKGYKKLVKGLETGKAELDPEAIEADRKRDGFYGVLTNIPKEKMTAEEVGTRYKDLWRIEDAFGEIKGPLMTRPMFHWTDQRIHAHVLICLLAYFVEAVITRTLRKENANFTVGEMFRALNEVYAIPVQVRGARAWVRNELRGVAAEGYQLLGIRPPDRVLKVEKMVEPGLESGVLQNNVEKQSDSAKAEVG
jgi:transposase